jgi:hypothetical protein
MKKLVLTTLLLLGLLGGLLFALTTASADPCSPNIGSTTTEVYSDDFVGKCIGQLNASIIVAEQDASASATSETTAVAVGDYSSAVAASDTDATAYNTISVTQSNDATIEEAEEEE